jgi:hypothetical protein
VMTLSRSSLPAWYFDCFASGGWADPYADIVLIVRRHFFQLTKLGVFMSRRGDGWGSVGGRCGQWVGRGRVGYTAESASAIPRLEDKTYPSGVGMAVPGA